MCLLICCFCFNKCRHRIISFILGVPFNSIPCCIRKSKVMCFFYTFRANFTASPFSCSAPFLVFHYRNLHQSHEPITTRPSNTPLSSAIKVSPLQFIRNIITMTNIAVITMVAFPILPIIESEQQK